jgi:hypothetical protein
MLLNWKKDNLKVVPLIPITDEAKKVQLKRSVLTLLPGINEVGDDEFLVAKPHLAANIKQGTLVVLQEKTATAPGRPQKPANSIVDLPVKKAVALIKETHSQETLNLWLALETRDEVRKRISARLKELDLEEVPADVPDGDEDEDEDKEEKVAKKQAKDEDDEDDDEDFLSRKATNKKK